MKLRIQYCAIIAAVCGLGLLATPVQAANKIQADSYTLDQGKELVGNLYVTGNSITIDGTVRGDVVAAAEKIIINGHVTGSVLAGASSITVNGTIDGSIRSASQELIVAGSVGGDITSVGEKMTLTKEGTVGDSLYFAGAAATLDGTVKGEIQKAVGDHSKPTAGEMVKAWLFSFLALALLGAVIYSLQPHPVTAELESYLRTKLLIAFGVGILTLIAAPILIIILLITQVGVWLGLLGLALMIILGLLAAVDACYFLGRLILTRGMVLPKYAVAVLLLGAVVITILSYSVYLSFVPFLIILATLGGRVMQMKHWLQTANMPVHSGGKK